jgi:CBS domain-containing protein
MMLPTVDPARIADRVRFLKRTPPFKGLPAGELDGIAASVRERAIAAGEAILVEGGPPGQELYIVRLGTLELLHKDAYVAIATAGEVVGHPTLLTGLAPEFTVRAREDSLLYCLPRAVAVAVLSHPAGLTWMAANSRERLLQAAGTLRALPDVRTLPVTSVTRSKPLFCDPETSAQQAARIMIGEKRSAILVRGPGGRGIAGIVTDVDLRNKVVVGGVSRHAPVTEIMSAPVHTIGAEVLAPEASIAMMAAGVNHMPVLNAEDEVVGVLSASSLMTLETRSPFALRREIMAARSEHEVVAAAADIPKLFVDLMTAHIDAPSVTRVLTVLHDSLTARFLELTIDRLGEPPVPYAWLAFGSAARSELTLASDQDNGLAYDDTDDPAVADYFRVLAQAVNAGLERCGLPRDPHGVLAGRREWRMTLSQWKAVFEDCLDGKDLDRLARASVAFDYRQIAGELYVDKVLTDVLRQVPEHKGFLRGLVKLGTKVRPPLSFRGRLEGSIDIKKNGLVPIQNLTRYYAFASGITAASTLERLIAVRDVVGESVESERVLREAFVSMQHLQLRHHANRLRNGRPLDNVIETWTLPPLTRASLQEALREVVSAQKRFKPVEPPR